MVESTPKYMPIRSVPKSARTVGTKYLDTKGSLLDNHLGNLLDNHLDNLPVSLLDNHLDNLPVSLVDNQDWYVRLLCIMVKLRVVGYNCSHQFILEI